MAIEKVAIVLDITFSECGVGQVLRTWKMF